VMRSPVPVTFEPLDHRMGEPGETVLERALSFSVNITALRWRGVWACGVRVLAAPCATRRRGCGTRAPPDPACRAISGPVTLRPIVVNHDVRDKHLRARAARGQVDLNQTVSATCWSISGRR
jgi:hypothetical protein